jgi:hypothetical protein
MKKLLLISFFLPLFAFSGIDWIRVKIDDRFSVDFPAKPEERELSGNPVWVADVNDDSRCMLMTFDFGKQGLDSVALATEMNRAGAFEEFRDGVLEQMEGSFIVSERNTKFNGYTSFEYVINMGKNEEGVLNIMYNKNIFVNDKMYSLSFYEKDKNPQEDARRNFFSSIIVR